MDSFSEEVDRSFIEILQYYNKSRLLFELGIRLTVIQEKVGIDEGTGNKYRICTVFSRKSSCFGCHAQFSTKITFCLKSN